MKAAVCYEYGKPLVIEDINLDSPGKDEVKIKLGATAICHSDIHGLKGELGMPLPIIGGHESAGYVQEVGANVTNVKVGDMVVASLIQSCGECPNCVSGLPFLCERKAQLNTVAHCHNKAGQVLNRFGQVAGFAEFAITHKSQVVVVPKDMPVDVASLLACGVITGFGAVVNRAKVPALSSVVVIGIGGVGLNSLQDAVISGANPIIAVDVLDNKLAASKSFGATHTINAKNEDPIQAVKKILPRGADYVFVTVGSGAAMRQAISMLGPRGTAVAVGLSRENFSTTNMELIGGEKTLTGTFMGATRLSVDIPKLVALYQTGRLKLTELITGRYPLEKINEAIESTVKGEALRNVIMFR